MRILVYALFATTVTFFVPNEDSRNTNIPDDNTHFFMPVYRSEGDWQARKDHLRMQILSAAGLNPLPPRNQLRPMSYGRVNRDGYYVEKILIQTLLGYYLGGNLYHPLNRTGKLPGVLVAHGHWKYGRLQNELEYSVPALAINLARQGYVVFAYDMVGYNDTRQTGHSFGGNDEQLWSFTPFGLQLWNSIRSLDYLESLATVDGNRLAITGASGGGTQTYAGSRG